MENESQVKMMLARAKSPSAPRLGLFRYKI